MRILHTADWHLGKTLKNASLIDDQDYLLNGEFIKLVNHLDPDVVIIAGDIYDRSVPPVEAIDLFDEIIYKINSRRIPLLCISGNHDSASRLNFAGRILAQTKFFITAKPQDEPKSISFRDDYGDVYFSLIPYFDPVDWREKVSGGDPNVIIDADAVNRYYIEQARKRIPDGKRSVAIAHLFVTGGKTSDSERKFVGTLDNVNKRNFAEYNYVALGHLHREQTLNKVKTNTIRYSGSPLKYSFSEVTNTKGVTLVEMNHNGEIFADNIPLTPRRDLRLLTGSLEDLCRFTRTEDFVHARIIDTKNILSAADRLRESAFPNLLSIEFLHDDSEDADFSQKLNVREGVSPLEHFVDFYEYAANETMPAAYRDAMENVIREVQRTV